MTKLYYTDPLAAAYMSREFGVSFDNGISAFECFVQSSGYETPHSYGTDADEHEELNVHPDSLDIFEPQAGDMIIHKLLNFGNEVPCYVHEVLGKKIVIKPCVNYYENTTKKVGKEMIGKIIQRDNKPFFMPEREVL